MTSVGNALATNLPMLNGAECEAMMCLERVTLGKSETSRDAAHR